MINLLSNPQQTRTKSQSHKDLDVTFVRIGFNVDHFTNYRKI